jgi:hypothetical protein
LPNRSNKEKSEYSSLSTKGDKKYRMEVPIAGVPEEVEIDDISINDIILDEENPRIGYWRDNILRVTDTTSQGDLELALKSGNIDEYNIVFCEKY